MVLDGLRIGNVTVLHRGFQSWHLPSLLLFLTLLLPNRAAGAPALAGETPRYEFALASLIR